jgi:hypothetical protein
MNRLGSGASSASWMERAYGPRSASSEAKPPAARSMGGVAPHTPEGVPCLG